eukprot:TRINITY_DN1286_c0_g1_i1.p1 TRINITY_DN1286_c0_g1~~TRINITY_DN1286_c0_g1_i1.p1  ORF type:complete len:212 (+),score=106.21 TRINITY_DN1286_c0_g1_i1:250-885(+)
MTLVPIVFGCVSYWIVGLNPAADRFLLFLLTIYLTTFVAESLGLVIAAIAPNAAVANGIAPLLLVFFLLFGGFYINNANISIAFVVLEYWSFIKYGYGALVVNEFAGRTFVGNDPVTNMPSTLTGEQVIRQLGMDSNNVTRDLVVLLAMGIVYRFLAYAILRFLRKGPRGGDLLPLSDTDASEFAAREDKRLTLEAAQAQRRTDAAKRKDA